MRVLVVNAGSSSLKLRLLGSQDEVVAAADLPALSGAGDDEALCRAIAGFGDVEAVGHRIVHGGTEFTAPVLIDDSVVTRLRALTDLAPLHQPKSLDALEATSSALPGVPAVASFDTAFHAGLPAAAATYALPAEWRRRFNLRRFGFHGLSHAYSSRRAAVLLGKPIESLRTVTCHLGAGASLAAVAAGRSVDTTMGFTPLEGLVMATRSGNVDAGLVLWLEEHAGIGPVELADTLEHRSGLLGLGGSADMRVILDRATKGVPECELALAVYVHRLSSAIASMAAAMAGLDALVFTGGVGEHCPEIRELAASRLGFLGVHVDRQANLEAVPDGAISAAGSPVDTLVIAAREDLEIASETRDVLSRALR